MEHESHPTTMLGYKPSEERQRLQKQLRACLNAEEPTKHHQRSPGPTRLVLQLQSLLNEAK